MVYTGWPKKSPPILYLSVNLFDLSVQNGGKGLKQGLNKNAFMYL